MRRVESIDIEISKHFQLLPKRYSLLDLLCYRTKLQPDPDKSLDHIMGNFCPYLHEEHVNFDFYSGLISLVIYLLSLMPRADLAWKVIVSL